jgi:dolichol-phosphate mannosyltransferase
LWFLNDEAQTPQSLRIKTLVIIPTYNERDNIAELIEAIRAHAPAADVLVIDDGSPDGTGQFVGDMGARDPQVSVLQRGAKLGLGTAYIAGFRHALREDYDCVVGMDADFSHDPARLPQLVAAAAESDLVIGSRYVPGGSTPDWTLHRRCISRFANWLARTTLRLPVRDCTTAYRCYRREALAVLDLDSVDVIGYSFLIEMTRQCSAAGLRIRELPIQFIDRRVGKSKMSGTIIAEALGYILRHAGRNGRRT